MTIAGTYIKHGLSKRANIFATLTKDKWWNPLHYVRKGAEWAFSGDDDAIAQKLKSKDYKSNMQDWKRHNQMIDRTGSLANNIEVHNNLSSQLNAIMRNKQLTWQQRTQMMADAYAKAQPKLKTVSEGWNQMAALGRYAGRYLNPWRWSVSDQANMDDQAMLGEHYLAQVSSDDMLNPQFVRRQRNIAAASDYALNGVKVNGQQVAIKDPALLARMTMIPDTMVANRVLRDAKTRLSGGQVDQHLNAAMDARQAIDESGLKLTATIPQASTTLNLGSMVPAQYSPAISAYTQRVLIPRITNIPTNTAVSMFNHVYSNDRPDIAYWTDMLKRLGLVKQAYMGV